MGISSARLVASRSVMHAPIEPFHESGAPEHQPIRALDRRRRVVVWPPNRAWVWAWSDFGVERRFEF